MTQLHKPHRRWHVVVELDGDTWFDVQSELEYCMIRVRERSDSCKSVGGDRCGDHRIRITEDPERTHEQWLAETEALVGAAYMVGSRGSGGDAT